MIITTIYDHILLISRYIDGIARVSSVLIFLSDIRVDQKNAKNFNTEKVTSYNRFKYKVSSWHKTKIISYYLSK